MSFKNQIFLDYVNYFQGQGYVRTMSDVGEPQESFVY